MESRLMLPVSTGNRFACAGYRENPDSLSKDSVERSLRNDYSTDSKNYAEIKRQSAIIKAALDPSAAGTLSAATAYMKNAPVSVVRESELGMAMQAQGMRLTGCTVLDDD